MLCPCGVLVDRFRKKQKEVSQLQQLRVPYTLPENSTTRKRTAHRQQAAHHAFFDFFCGRCQKHSARLRRQGAQFWPLRRQTWSRAVRMVASLRKSIIIGLPHHPVLVTTFFFFSRPFHCLDVSGITPKRPNICRWQDTITINIMATRANYFQCRTCLLIFNFISRGFRPPPFTRRHSAKFVFAFFSTQKGIKVSSQKTNRTYTTVVIAPYCRLNPRLLLYYYYIGLAAYYYDRFRRYPLRR